MKNNLSTITLLAVTLTSCFAQDDEAELAKQLSNPVASLISVPFQFNYDDGFGPQEASRLTLNVQPVIPISISNDWNLIIRTIVPFIDAESPAPGIDSATGMGDITQSFFFSPKEPTSSGWVWAVGPVFYWPTATDTLLGAEKWGAGPTALLLKQQGGWTYGVLANHLWSYAGDDNRSEISNTFLQPFLSYTSKTKTTFTLNAESTYDWKNSQWTVPINAIVAQMFKIGNQPMQFGIGARYYAEGPDNGPEWGLRASFTLLFPKK